MLTVSPLYISLMTLLYVALAVRVIRQRPVAKATRGDGGDRELAKRIRAHGNFAEYAPILMILLVLCELQGAPAWVLHGLGLIALLSRAGHAYFISQTPEPLKMRVVTMAATFTLLGVMSLGLIAHTLF